MNACHIAPQHINSDRVVEPKPPPTTSSIVNIPINPMPPHSNHEATAKRFTSNPQMQLVTIPNGYNGYRVCIIVHSMICTLFESFQRYTSFGCKTGSIELNQYLRDLQTKFNIKQSLQHQITTPCIYLHQKKIGTRYYPQFNMKTHRFMTDGMYNVHRYIKDTTLSDEPSPDRNKPPDIPPAPNINVHRTRHARHK